MLKYNHILYAVDISDELDSLIKKIIESAKLTDTKVTIVHFIQLLSNTYLAYYAYDTPNDLRFQAKMVKNAEDELLPLLNKYGLDASNLSIETTTNVKTALLDKAKDLNVDAIYLNGHKHNILGRLSSVADYIINKSDYDVIILK